MPRSSASALFLRHIEIWLSLAGVAVIFALPLALSDGAEADWAVVLWVALLVTVLHGAILWAVRHRQRLLRERTIAEMRRMLRDRINNRLGVVVMTLSLLEDQGEGFQETITSVQADVDEVTEMLDHLSQESLAAWKQRYSNIEQVDS